MHLACNSGSDDKRLVLGLFVVTLCALMLHADGHGSMMYPNQRGALSRRSLFVTHIVDGANEKEVDYYMHFPAGDKSSRPGAGLHSQRAAAGQGGWVPYDPFDRNFAWRAGVCGDTVRGKDHLRGGRYYDDGRISATYRQGGVIDIEMGVTAHHNGFVEMFVCDVSRCEGGDISPKCFQDGHCYRLDRARGDECETRTSTKCAPADPNYPSRWYFPCDSFGKRNGRWTMFGPGAARFRLPKNLACDHCVLQWYWVAANTCNPPGVKEFFEGSRSPTTWGRCSGQGGAFGGFTAVQGDCGGSDFPEEYYQCADIEIRGLGSSDDESNYADDDDERADNRKEPSPSPVPSTVTVPPPATDPLPVTAPPQLHTPISDEEYDPSKHTGYGAVLDIVLVSAGRRIGSLHKQHRVDVSSLRDITIEAYTSPGVEEISFEVYDSRGRKIIEVTRRGGAPFYLFGTSGSTPVPWSPLPLGETMRIVASGKLNNRHDRDSARFMFEG